MDAALTAGAMVDGRYALDKMLGDGAFGEVWRAGDTRLSGRAVAIKFLKPEHMAHPELVARFDAEADALALLRHPNVVGVSDRGTWQGIHYVVTEFVEGVSLKDWLLRYKRDGRPTELFVVQELFDQMCAGVEAAHAVRSPGAIVHRDLKPDNVLIQELPGGEFAVKVLDFGVAQLGGRKGTRTGVSIGTPRYMAPEQAMGEAGKVGPWTDVFALGVILVELLTQRGQFAEDESWWATVIQSAAAVRGMLGLMRDDVPPQVWDVASNALQVRGAERYGSAGAMRSAMRNAWAAADPRARASAAAAPRESSRLPARGSDPTVAHNGPIAARQPTASPWLAAAAAPVDGALPTRRDLPTGTGMGTGTGTGTGTGMGAALSHVTSASSAVVAAPARRRKGLIIAGLVLSALLMVSVGIIMQSLFISRSPADARADSAIAPQRLPTIDPTRTAPSPWIASADAAAGSDVAVLTLPVVPSTRRPNPASAAAAGATTPGAPPAGNEPPPGANALVGEFLQRWYAAAIGSRGAALLDPYYVLGGRFRASGAPYSLGDASRYWQGFFRAGNSFAIDWSRSTVEIEAPDQEAGAAAYCGSALPNAEGPVYKIRAWATETMRPRPAAIGCERLEEVYLVRLRRVLGAFRICYETWSTEGVCRSCPTAPICQQRAPAGF